MKCLKLIYLICSLLVWLAFHQPAGNSEKIWKQGKAAAVNGNTLEALQIWETAKSSAHEYDPDPRIGFDYIELVTERKLTDFYRQASDMFYWGLSGRCIGEHEQELKTELERIKPIISARRYKQWKGYLDQDLNKFCRTLNSYWKYADPIISTDYNERLIEHWERIAYSKTHFTENKTTVYGADDRATVYIKLGEPDYRRKNSMRYNRTQVRSWVLDAMDFPSGNSLRGGSSSSGDSLSGGGASAGDRRPDISQSMMQNRVRLDRAERFSREAEQLHRIRDYEVWVYLRDKNNSVKDYDRNLVYIFGEHGDTGFYGMLRSLEDMIPDAAFRDRGVQGSLLSPAYLLQLLFYHQLLTVDDYFADAFYDLESRLTSVNGLNKMAAFSARSQNINELNYIQVQAPEQASTFEEEKRGIDLHTHQYRLLDENNEPYLATYIEGRPQKALVFSRVKEKKYGRDDFQLTYYAKATDTDFNVVHLKDKVGKLHLLEKGNVEEMPLSRIFFRIPNYTSGTEQYFTAELRIADSIERDSTSEGDITSMSAFGKTSIYQPKPLSTDPEVLEMSDIIVGSKYTIAAELEGAPADFEVAYDNKIPINKNLMIHFEVYHLENDVNAATANSFEVRYKVRPEKRNLFQRIFKGDDNISLTLNFETLESFFKTDLEIVTSAFETGRYQLELEVSERSTGRNISRTIDFEIVDSAQE